jgi:hypothetical protein
MSPPRLPPAAPPTPAAGRSGCTAPAVGVRETVVGVSVAGAATGALVGAEVGWLVAVGFTTVVAVGLATSVGTAVGVMAADEHRL